MPKVTVAEHGYALPDECEVRFAEDPSLLCGPECQTAHRRSQRPLQLRPGAANLRHVETDSRGGPSWHWLIESSLLILHKTNTGTTEFPERPGCFTYPPCTTGDRIRCLGPPAARPDRVLHEFTSILATRSWSCWRHWASPPPSELSQFHIGVQEQLGERDSELLQASLVPSLSRIVSVPVSLGSR